MSDYFRKQGFLKIEVSAQVIVSQFESVNYPYHARRSANWKV